jgi:chemotaxis protein MotB
MPNHDSTQQVPKRGGGAVLPWLLFLATAGGAGYGYVKLHRPAVDERDKLYADVKKQFDAARAAQAELKAAQDELAKTREDLAKSSTQKTEDAKLLEQLRKEAGGNADVKGGEGQITLTMVDKILFKSGEAALTPQGEQVLQKFGGVLKNVDKLIEVGGHADNLPVESAVKELYPTNWELAAARATNVVRFLEERVGIKPRRLKAAGFGSHRPVASNKTAQGRAKNRRIEILLMPDRMKVVKGDFSEELAAAPPPPPPAKATAPKPSDKERAKAVTAMRGKTAKKR